MPKTVEQFARQALTVRPRMASTLRAGVGQAALAVKLSVTAEEEAVGVKGGRLRGVGVRGARIGVRYTIRGQVQPTALLRAVGPFHLIERSTAPHVIRPRRKAAVVIPGVGPRASVHHPGTRGKYPWRKGVERALPAARAIVAKSVRASIIEGFKL